MKTALSLLILVLISASGLSAQDSKTLAEEAIAAERSFWQAEVDRDLEVIKSLLDNDYISITTRPEVDFTIIRGKNGAMAGLEQALAQGRYEGFEINEPETQVYGNTVVVIYSWKQTYLPTAEGASQPINTRGVATSIWVKRDDAWKNVHFHWHTRPDPQK